MEEGAYEPRQYAKAGGIHEFDLRSLAQSNDKSAIPNRDPTHPSGGKRKRAGDEDAEGAGTAPDAPTAMEVEAGAAGDGEVTAPGAKRRAYDNVSGKVSHRPWKASFPRHSSLAGRPPADWDARMRAKAQKKALQSHVEELRKEARAKTTAEKARREEVKKRKEQNKAADLQAQKVTKQKPKKAGKAVIKR